MEQVTALTIALLVQGIPLLIFVAVTSTIAAALSYLTWSRTKRIQARQAMYFDASLKFMDTVQQKLDLMLDSNKQSGNVDFALMFSYLSNAQEKLDFVIREIEETR